MAAFVNMRSSDYTTFECHKSTFSRLDFLLMQNVSGTHLELDCDNRFIYMEQLLTFNSIIYFYL